MKWQGNLTKTIFVDWANNATKEELKDYAIERKLKMESNLTTISVSILILLAYIGIASLVFFFVVYKPFVYEIHTITEGVGKYLCGDDGYIKYEYLDHHKSLVIYCSAQIIKISGGTQNDKPDNS